VEHEVGHGSHSVRDVTDGEDRSQVRDGTVAQAMASLRNGSIGRLRMAGHANIAAATRCYAARPKGALALLGLTTEFLNSPAAPGGGRWSQAFLIDL
jgi:hypothetical protein